jgi:Epoxide hydrolase N terminus.
VTQEHDENWIRESEKDSRAVREASAGALLLPSAIALGQTQPPAKPEPAPIRPFKMHVPDRVLIDLRRRLAEANWPDQLPGTTWEYGADIKKVRELADYWQNGYDWRAQEAKINQFDQFTTEIDGQQIYFIHQRSPRPDAIPLMLIHGWPGSILEFEKLIGPLTIPRTKIARHLTLSFLRFLALDIPDPPQPVAGAHSVWRRL